MDYTKHILDLVNQISRLKKAEFAEPADMPSEDERSSSKEAVIDLIVELAQLKDVSYPFIEVWGRQLCSFPSYISSQKHAAAEAGVSHFAVYRAGDGEWKLARPTTLDSVVVAAYKLVMNAKDPINQEKGDAN